MSDSPKGSMGKLALTSLAVMCGAFTFGIEAGTIAGFQAMIPWLEDFGYFDKTLGIWSIHTNVQTAVGVMVLVGAVLGAAISGPLGTRYGRRPGLFGIGVAAVIGVILQVVYPHLALLLLGRLFQGAAIGLASNFVPIYQSEVSPAQYRGLLVSLYQLGINIGGLLGTCINQGTHALTSRWSYRIPLLASTSFPIALFIMTFFLPESPRWLVSVDRVEEAHKALRSLRGAQYPEEQIQQDIGEIRDHLAMERINENAGSYLDLFKGTDRRRTLIVVFVLAFQVLSGITFINAYGTYFFFVSGITNVFVITVVSAVCQLAGLLFLFPTLRFMGRRSLLLAGSIAEGLSLFAFAITDVVAPGSKVAARCLVAFTCLFGFFFTWTWGPVAWIVASEVPSNTLRSRTLSIASSINWTVSLIVALVTPYLINPTAANLGGKVGFIFGSFTFVGFFWVWFFLPETNGRSLEQLDELFASKTPTRKFHNAILHDYESEIKNPVGKVSVEMHIENAGGDKKAS